MKGAVGCEVRRHALQVTAAVLGPSSEGFQRAGSEHTDPTPRGTDANVLFQGNQPVSVAPTCSLALQNGLTGRTGRSNQLGPAGLGRLTLLSGCGVPPFNKEGTVAPTL